MARAEVMKHKMQYTYARGRVLVTCSCGQARIGWQPGDTSAEDLKKMLAKVHPPVEK